MLILGTNAYNPAIMNNATSGGGSDIPTTLGSRIDNKATVVGVLQDHEGNDYVLAVVDAAYRSDTGLSWGQYDVDTPLQDDENKSDVLADHHTGKYNTDLILSTYNASDYPAFNIARNACTVTIGNNTYYSVLPSLIELQLLWNNKDVLDQYDPTVSQYSNRSMSEFSFGHYGSWASNEEYKWNGWRINYVGEIFYDSKNIDHYYSVCPVICIPLS